ncbi:MAG: calcineurin-like phosphoesterase C-terminal domain-containing protein [Bacteroidales bacterium]|nr:calcineurin-like phosphoesterase C-terminal domain-containing protein [Bacteroidales bacterium]
MKSFRLNAFTAILPFFILVLSLPSCKKKDLGTPDDSFNVSGVILPELIETTLGATLEIGVTGGHGPVAGDEVVFNGADPFRCKITSAQADRFSFVLGDNVASGDYRVTIERDGKSKGVGRTQLIVTTGIQIDPEGKTVYGQVSSKGIGIKGVVVSDGVLVTETDENGIYRLDSNKAHGYVFISVPSGYEPLSNGALPRMHRLLTSAANVAERADFALVESAGWENAKILLFGDIHLARRTNDRAQFSSFVSDVNSYLASHSGEKIYGLTLGDMVWDLYWKVNNYSFREYRQELSTINGLTIWQTIGNHDHSMYYPGDDKTVADYTRELLPNYYSFNVGGVHFVSLDNVECTNSRKTTDSKGNPCYEREYTANLVTEQIEWLKKDLSYIPTTTPLVVTMHIPMFNEDGSFRMGSAVSSKFEEILSKYKEVHLFSGHTHTVYNNDKSSSNNIYEHTSGAVCGTWWWSGYETPGIHIGQDGSPGGYLILSVNNGSFSWQFKATGSDTDYQFRTYDRNCIHLTADKYVASGSASYKSQFTNAAGIWKIESSANEVYINVWNYDPSWKIEVTENGSPLSVTRVNNQPDPLHLLAYTAKRLNKNSEAGFATTPNRHMFRVTASSESSTLEIKVTDKFGNIYTETMERPKQFDIETYIK